MLSTLQIVLLSIIGVCAVLSIIFMIMFIVEISVQPKEKHKKEEGDIFVNQNITIQTDATEEASVNEMLANLEEQTKDELQDDVKEEENTEEVKEETEVEELNAQEVVEENEASAKEEESVVETNNSTEETEYVSVEHEAVNAGSLVDLKARLEKITENRDKIDRDLSKLQKSILKYERTKRRMNRNQKMLDRRAGELTNLNLVMYSVTDIKNVDEEKKTKQEELTAHIAELKASIQDADEFIESNKEKNEHNVKMAKFLVQEKSRYNEEIAELKELIKKAEDSSDNA